MTDPQSVADYDDRGVAAARSILVEIGQILGAYRDCFVIIGGSVPALALPNADPMHIGTTDVDLGLDPEALSDGQYAGLVEALEKRGYVRSLDGMKRFQLRKAVALDDGPPVAVIVDLLMPRDAKPEKRAIPLVPDFAVQKGDGVGLALRHSFWADIEGMMPDGRRNQVTLKVASIPAFLVMKGHALVGRDKKKDAYDIYYCIRNYEDGIDALVEACRPLLAEAEAERAYRNIATKFAEPNGFGPATVRMFLAEQDGMGDMTLDEVETDSHFQVRAWARGLFPDL